MLDFMVVSEEVGFKKPSAEIFAAALQRADAVPSEAVYVGDSWVSDILPAHRYGIRTIWLNRYGLKCPNPEITTEIQSYTENDFQKLFPKYNKPNSLMI
jgi:FMN phosphatase YigB (HAD superfamily)